MKASLRTRAAWYGKALRALAGYRRRYAGAPGWPGLMTGYFAHSIAGVAGVRTRRYQVRVPGDPNPLTVRLGTSDFHALVEVHLAGVYAFAIPALTSLHPPITTVLDLGANAGYTVRLWARLFPGCTIVAVEPDEDNLALCLANAGPGAGSVQGVRCFAGGTSRDAYLDRSLGAWAYRLADRPSGDAATTPVHTITEIVAGTALAGKPIDLLKCDIEGSEVELFRGGPGWLNGVRAVLAEVHGDYTAEALAADVRSAGGRWQVVVDRASVLLLRQ